MTAAIEFERATLLVLDVQNDIVAATPDVEPVLANMERVLAAVRDRGLPISYATVSFRDDYSDAPWQTHPLYKMVREYKMVLANTPGGRFTRLSLRSTTSLYSIRPV
jgi:nicotinamidase-related amidase